MMRLIRRRKRTAAKPMASAAPVSKSLSSLNFVAQPQLCALAISECRNRGMKRYIEPQPTFRSTPLKHRALQFTLVGL